LRCRFAPSPTGDLHLGNARTALLAWLQARSSGGRFALRVEDLDPGRVRGEYLQTQLIDLRWLGLDWDEGPDLGGPHAPYLQSLRRHLYDQALDSLDRQGLLYRCRCSRREILAAASAPHAPDDEGPAYPGTCRARSLPEAAGDYALRFSVPGDSVSFYDQVQGSRRYTPALETGDFVVRRKDGVAAYQLAVVVDDAAMEITDVLRGADLLPSTARQILLYRALGLPEPRWAHVPLLLDEEGDRLAKRVASLTLRHLRLSGCSPERLVGWLASTCGLARVGTELSPADLLPRFDLEQIPRHDTPARIPTWITEPSAGNS
jgi:glutamyl-tRNA synthetase